MSQSSKEMDEPDFPDLDYKIRADCSFPLSLPSQPPDIRDWFSSYQYESPDPSHPSHDLDETQDPLGGFEIQQQEGPPKFNNKDESRVKDDRVLSEDGQYLVATTERSDDEENGSAQEEISKVPVSGLKRKQAVRRVLGETCTNDDGLPANENSNKLKVGEDTLQREQSPKGCRSGELAASASKDGFISTKKRERSRPPPMAVSIKNQENVEATSGVKRGGKYEHLMREELNGTILADKTNVQVEVEQGNTGRWQCPRKRKPYAAPPLKQLRLEQWVRRVN